jgi:RP/EB family microtubule-associated protein
MKPQPVKAAAPKGAGGIKSHEPSPQAAELLHQGARLEPTRLLIAASSVTQLQITVDGLEKERDFYFGKLRDIEVLIQAFNSSGVSVVG